ncbi:Imm1 family immunity protein [Plantactinospora sp. WMMC1484]|uniref:Imm1 family immunity protein n=1 Tax=Plantactinospora sp. WMMC1484 TaxID=3404122 RepID=UPI003BF4BA55
MSFVATWTILNADGTNSGDEMVIRSATDVADLISALGQPGATAALVRHEQRPTVQDDEGRTVPDHDMSVGVWQGFGYLTYADPDHDYETLAGVPESPEFAAHYVEYDTGTGVPLDRLQAALVEFLESARRPSTVDWQEPL